MFKCSPKGIGKHALWTIARIALISCHIGGQASIDDCSEGKEDWVAHRCGCDCTLVGPMVVGLTHTEYLTVIQEEGSGGLG